MTTTTFPTQSVKIEKAFITLLDENIFYVQYNQDVFLELSDFEEVRKIFDEWSTFGMLKVLVDFPEFTSASKEARDFAEKYPIDARAEAIVFKSLAQRMLVNFYLRVHRQQHPVKVFRSLEKARMWLNSLET